MKYIDSLYFMCGESKALICTVEMRLCFSTCIGGSRGTRSVFARTPRNSDKMCLIFVEIFRKIR